MKRKVEVEESRQRLETFLAQDNQESLGATLLRCIEDPLRPRTRNGRFRLNPILLLLWTLSAIGLIAFSYFSLVHL
jgi:hypothetical protein